MAYLSRFLLVILLIPTFLYAAVVSPPAWRTMTSTGGSMSGYTYSSAEAACSAGVNLLYGTAVTYTSTVVLTITTAKCYGKQTGSPFHLFDINALAPTTCPVGSTNFNGSCICTPPLIDSPDKTSCVDPAVGACKEAKDLYNSTMGERYTDVEMPGTISSGTSVCVPSSKNDSSGVPYKCTMNFERDISFLDAKGAWVSRGRLDMGGMMGNYTVLPCGQDPNIPQVLKDNLNPPCPSGQQSGTVNGSIVCKPFGPDVTSKTTDKVTKTTNPDGSITTTTQTTDCKGSSCTTSTSTVNNVSSANNSTKTETAAKSDFCSRNSGSPQCSSTQSAVPKSACESAPDSIGCSKFGDPGATTPTANTDIALTFSRESGFGASNGTCPAPRVLHIPGGRTISMSFDMYCSFALGMRPFIIGFALLSAAGMVVFGSTRKG